MNYRIKNTGTAEYRFEGLVIPAGEVSEPLDSDTYSRNLAIGWNDSKCRLRPFEGEKEEKAEKEPVKTELLVCDVCGKECKNLLGLNAHKRSHNKKQE